MIKFSCLILIFLSGCFYDGLSQFSEDDISQKESVIINPGFEEGNFGIDKLPDGWTIIDKPENSIFWENKISHSGSKCLKVFSPHHDINLFSEAFVLTPQEFHFSNCYVKSNNHKAKPITITFLAFNLTGKKVDQFSEKITPLQSWTALSVSSGYFDNTAIFGRIVISIPKDRSTIFWIDDINSYKIYKLRKRWE